MSLHLDFAEFTAKSGRVVWNRGVTRRKRRKPGGRCGLFLGFLRTYGEKASNPGVMYIYSSESSFLERLFWIATMFLMVVFIVALLRKPWHRFRNNPTVISIDKNFRSWRTFLPAITFCPSNACNDTKARQVIKSVWNVSESEAKFNYYLNFTRQVVNLNLNRKSLSNFEIYADDSSLTKISMLDLAMQVVKAFPARFNVHQEGYNSSKFNLSILEVGLCQTFGGVLSEYFSLSKSVSASNFDPPQCYYTSASCYGFMELQNLFDGGKVYIHSPFEVATLENRYVLISLYRSVGLEFTSQEMLSADSVRYLSVAQRGCKFMEDVTYPSIPVYSYNICKMHCRKQLAIKFCKCSPYLYFHVDPVQMCDARGLGCIQKHLKFILKFEDTNGSKIDCGCIPNCNEVLVTSFTDENTIWPNEMDQNFSRYGWNIQKFSRERYIRNVLYNVEDFVVSVGSFVGLFLGGSLLSLVELHYFFTLRLFWYLRGHSSKRIHVRPRPSGVVPSLALDLSERTRTIF